MIYFIIVKNYIRAAPNVRNNWKLDYTENYVKQFCKVRWIKWKIDN